ncbi:MAG TPA: DUF1629 domain-containing protein [Vicinamibacterales bacterium]|jgi:hypothetical protein
MYYAMMRSGKPGRWIKSWPYIEDVTWNSGALITQAIPDPFPVSLKPINPDAEDHAPYLPAFLKGNGPLFRDDLVEAMRAFGVDNLQTFNAALTDPEDGQTHTNYKAVNIIGVIAAADMAQSEATVHAGGPIIDVDFDSLVIDESKTRGFSIFRLAESTNALLVSERLRDYLVSRNFGDDIAFYDPKEVAL